MGMMLKCTHVVMLLTKTGKIIIKNEDLKYCHYTVIIMSLMLLMILHGCHADKQF